MPETVATTAAAFLLLAAATYRFRFAAGVASARDARLLRGLGAVLIVVAFARAGTALGGERCVRLLGGASIAAVAVTVMLSLRPGMALAPVRRLLRLTR